ncbi:MAG: hypothetical protein DWQ18_09365 [Crenarchaeota archaeon]|nr:MAG: hypothetical protein DWQ17_00420 [Thermoproteota archaeon]RDJ33336.1 MAG: hypothetical protein DWQ18_09365 [Thermoproteota archaeon]RDJ36161.1 MAG: hypothetical protein DWQ19_05955 [Thermoproteota archaeon]RDJ38792.1 MAG: hypothetical protein DWQ13_00420 [Thermoproteota archaeon]
MQKKKDIVVGMGEIGNPLQKLLSKNEVVLGYDINPTLMNSKKFNDFKNLPTSFLHICIPFTKNFFINLNELNKKFQPECIVIHSTIQPNTTKILQEKSKIPIIYSAVRGVHKRMIKDMKKYTKFYSIYKWAPNSTWAAKQYEKKLKKAGITPKQMTTPLTLELAKIVVDTSYYGWLITYAQLSNLIAKENNVDYDEMWSFSDEIHKYLGNRPKMYPGFIGGHCVIPNLDLIQNQTLNLIKKINSSYSKKIKNSKSIYKKYSK